MQCDIPIAKVNSILSYTTLTNGSIVDYTCVDNHVFADGTSRSEAMCSYQIQSATMHWTTINDNCTRMSRVPILLTIVLYRSNIHSQVCTFT